ncbi:hypothetical protein [Streptomyces sp. ODS28]|uniref:hypothetical protein n=1 Tax=Streptomyces sp. ODS28 TaxID=3136688 RepID=UPI0031ED4728
MDNRREPNERLRALIAEAGWTQEGLARAVNALGGEIGDELRYDRSAVAHWLTGTAPRPPVPQLIAEALSRRTGRTVTPREAGFRAPGRSGSAAEGSRGDPATSTPADGAPPEDTAPADTAAAPVDGIAALREAATAPPGGLPLQRRPYRTAEARVPPGPSGGCGAPGPTPLPGPRVAALDGAVRSFAGAIDAHGGLRAREGLACCLAEEVAPLLRAPMPHRERRRVLVSAGRLCLLLGRMYADALRHGAAQRCFTYAHQLATEAGDRETWATALRMMSAQARQLGHREHGLRLAEAAAGAVGTGAPGRRAYVLAQLAVMRAEYGERRDALESLSLAEHAVAEEEERAPGGPFDAYPAAALSFQRSLVLEALEDTPGAIAALERSRTQRAPEDVRGLALSEARLARLLLRSGRLDEACQAWHGFLDRHGRLDSGAARRELHEARRALRPYRGHRPAARLLARAHQHTG